MQKNFIAAVTVLAAALVAGCGGGSQTTTASIAGKVADGYLVNATLFMDKNGNYQLDAGEPFTMTDANGGYSLTVDPADVGRYPIVALATRGVTIDKDTGTAVENSYLLTMHAVSVTASAADTLSGSVTNFISPLSTQLRILMDTGTYTTMQQAMDALRPKLGLPAGTNMLADYMATNNTAMHTAARNMATLMGSQMPQVMGTGGPASTVDVGRYQGMMVAIFKNMSSIKGSDASAQSNMSDLMGAMTTTLQNAPSGMGFHNISSAIRGMMGGPSSTTPVGSYHGNGMMGR